MLALIYGIACYAIFFATFLYAVGFMGNLLVPKGIDSREPGALPEAIAVNLMLLTLFAIQHSVMARPAFKRWWQRLVPQPVERSTYVLATNVVLILLFWLWRPMPAILWDFDGLPRMIAWGLFAIGWTTVLISTFLINHFELFGLRQVYLHATGRPHTPIGFRTPALHAWVRHPIMLGFIIAFGATPVMTAGHLLFAAVTTAYILVAIRFEEHDLVTYFGDEYRAYQKRVPMLLPLGKGGQS